MHIKNKTVLSLIIIFIRIFKISCGHNEKRLLEHLFSPNRPYPHNVLERPAQNDSLPVEVRIKSVLTQIIDVDEKNQIIHTNIWLDIKWRDYHFAWNPADFGGVQGINIPAEKVWKPDLLLFNSADDKFDGTYPVNVVVRNTTLMQWVPPGMFKSTCDIDITWFPFDNQTCTLKFGSWTYSGQYIDLKLQCPDDNNNMMTGNCTREGFINLDEYIVNGEFDLIGNTIIRYQYTYNNATFMYILLTIGIQRKPLYYVFNLIIPCVLISTMALLEFTLPPDAGEKISLGVTILLSMTMFLLLVADKLPQTSGAIPLIGKYFTCIIIMCSLSIVFTVLVLNYHHRSVNLKPVPPLMKKIVNKWLAKVVFMKHHIDDEPVSQNNIRKSIVPDNNTGGGSTLMVNPHNSMHRMPTGAESFTNYIEVEEDFRVSGLGQSNNINNNYSKKPPVKFPAPPSYMNFQNIENEMPSVHSYRQLQNSCSSRNDLTLIIKELKKITQKIKDDEEESVMAKEWKFAARVIDRVCLITFSMFTLILTLSILTQHPKGNNKILV